MEETYNLFDLTEDHKLVCYCMEAMAGQMNPYTPGDPYQRFPYNLSKISPEGIRHIIQLLDVEIPKILERFCELNRNLNFPVLYSNYKNCTKTKQFLETILNNQADYVLK